MKTKTKSMAAPRKKRARMRYMVGTMVWVD